MADARVTRLSREILAAAPESAKVTRQGVQVAMEDPRGETASNNVQATRFSFEVLALMPDRAKVTRQGVQVAMEDPRGETTANNVRTTRSSFEVLAETPPRAQVTRQGIQAAFQRPGANAALNARVTRFSYETLGRTFIPMTTFTVPAAWEFFLHNWAKRSILESAYSTDITSSAADVAEERTGLLQKPWRTLQLQWAVKGNVEVNQMLVELRRLLDEVSVVPLYMDATMVTQAQSGTPTIFGDFSQGRFNRNGPVVIFSFKPTVDGSETIMIDTYELGVIDVRFDNRLELKSNLSATYPGNGRTYVMPLMQTHPQVEIEVNMLTNKLLRIDMSFDEIYGETALPPTFTDLPPNFESYNQIPILSTVPDWSNGLVQTLRREGSQDALGRGRVVYQRGARQRVMHRLRFVENRTIAWDLIRFFDAARGRLVPFWVIDFEDIYNVALISNPNVTVSSSIGTLAEFQNEMEYIGIIFKDGRAAVRQATVIQDIGGAWRITMDANLPAGYTAADVEAFGRARLCRMQSDALKEEWHNTTVCMLDVPVIELLAEQEVTP